MTHPRRLLTPPRTLARRCGAGWLIAAALLLQLGSCSPTFDFEEPAASGGTGAGGASSSLTTTGAGGTTGTSTSTSGAGAGGEPTTDLCENRQQDPGETDEDCGGPDCDPCEDASDCELDRDCVLESCVQDVCQPPACGDGELSPELGETDEDCGGEQCMKCDDGEDCELHRDCISAVCSSGTCEPRNCDDNTVNGVETDVDCGGGQQDDGETCDRCSIGSTCVQDSDCVTPDAEFGAVSKCEDPDPEDDDDAKRCVLKCPPNQGDCNLSHLDGCETDLNTTTEHCGACDGDCSPNNAQGQCVVGNCQLVPDSCVTGFANCNGSPTDGCEVDISIDPDFCGSCEIACSDNHGSATCTNGVCGITCDADFDDCNEDVGDGCEADLLSSALHCSACETPCTAASGFSASCDDGVCKEVDCGGIACGGQEPCGACDDDQTCDDVLDNEANCGACGVDCIAQNGTPECQSLGAGAFACGIGSCTAPFADCDGALNNGCEVNTVASTSRCGGCLASDPNPGDGGDCAAAVGSQHIAEATCASGGCSITSCNNGWADCDGDFDNGCEVDIRVNPDHCGGCTSGPTSQWDGGISCDGQFENGTGQCDARQCIFEACTGAWGDCNGDATLATLGDGCETNTDSSTSHCGGCSSAGGTPSGGVDCTDAIGMDDIADVDCTTGECEVRDCEGDAEDCNLDFDDGCEIDTASDVDHCGGCGDACPAEPHASVSGCDSGACDYDCASGWRDANSDFSDGCETAIIALVSPPDPDNTSHTSRDTGSGTALTIPHSLLSSPGNHRLLLVGLACKGSDSARCYPSVTASFGTASDTIPLTQLGASLQNTTGAAIYYALDADLPAAGNYTVTLLNSFNGYNALSAHVMELTGVEQDQFWAARAGVTNGSNCNINAAGQADIQTTLTGLPTGSRIFAVVAGQGNSIYTNALGPLLDDIIGSQSQNEVGFGTGWSISEVSGSQTPAFELAYCNYSTLYAVGIRPESNY